jgi:hypothetical protein
MATFLVTILRFHSKASTPIIYLQCALPTAKNVLFFGDQAYMALTHCTATALAAEGIVIPKDLSEIDKEGMNSIHCNLRKPTKVLRAGVAGVHGELQEIQAYELLAISQICLMIGAAASKFYDNIGCALDPDNMMWTVFKHFDKQHNALMARKAGDSTYVPPKLTKNFSTYKWLELFVLCLHQKVGVRNCTLVYLVRDNAVVAAICPPLEPFEPRLAAEQGGSIKGDTIARMSHAHPLFKVDNGAVFELIENTVRGTAITASILPFQREPNGRGAFMAIRAQHAGKFTRKLSLSYRLSSGQALRM